MQSKLARLVAEHTKEQTALEERARREAKAREHAMELAMEEKDCAFATQIAVLESELDVLHGAEVSELRRLLEEAQREKMEAHGKLFGAPGKKGVLMQLEDAQAPLDEIRSMLDLDYKSIPTVELNGTHMAYCRNVRFVAAALKDRDPIVIASALRRNDQKRSTRCSRRAPSSPR
jgi:hypothetical protein